MKWVALFIALLLVGCLTSTTQTTVKENSTRQRTLQPSEKTPTITAIQTTAYPSTNGSEPKPKDKSEKPTPTAWGTVKDGAYIAKPFVKSFETNPDELADSSELKKVDWKRQFECEEVQYDLDTRGLEPKLPLARCGVRFKPGDTPAIILYFYVTIRNGQPIKIRIGEFNEIFGPVDSPAEAVAFARLIGPNKYFPQGYAPSSYFADSKAEFVKSMTEKRWYVPVVNGTHAETVPGGYVVNLFDTAPGNCQEQIKQANVFVAKNGLVETREIIILAEHPGFVPLAEKDRPFPKPCPQG